MQSAINYKNFFRRIIHIVAYTLWLSIFIVILDIVYVKFFERIPPVQNSVYTQAFASSIHRRSNIGGLFYELKPNAKFEEYEINSLGIRGPMPNPVKDSYRIIVMGDSVAFGPHVYAKERFTAIAEKILNSQGKKVEIINISVSCYNTKQEYIALKEKYLFLKPDLVIFAFCANDTGEAAIQYLPEDYIQKTVMNQGIEHRELFYTNVSKIQYLSLSLPGQFSLPYKLDRWLLLHSGIYRAVSLLKFKITHKIRNFKDLPNFIFGFDFKGTVQDIKKFSIDRSFSLRFMILPTLNQWYRDPVFTALTASGIEFWDLDTPAFKKDMAEGCFPVDGTHFTAKGHLIVGQALAEELKKIIP